jgi:hypothetical protein
MKMKNKRVKQIEARLQHKTQKQNRRKPVDLMRPAPSMLVKPTILIVCEGTKTEPSYFEQFRLASATIKPVGTGFNTITLVQKASELARERSYDQIWCVFDKDDFPDEDFNNAIDMARHEGMGVAYSNQAFEYWIILHFEDHQGGGIDRKDYHKKINAHLKQYDLEYDGKGCKIVTHEMYQVMYSKEATGKHKVELAIERAERIYNQFDHASPAKEESSTTVFKLVRELLKYV